MREDFTLERVIGAYEATWECEHYDETRTLSLRHLVGEEPSFVFAYAMSGAWGGSEVSYKGTFTLQGCRLLMQAQAESAHYSSIVEDDPSGFREPCDEVFSAEVRLDDGEVVIALELEDSEEVLLSRTPNPA